MKRIRIVFAALAAVAGIGGAYANVYQVDTGGAGTIYNWYTCNGQFINSTTINTAKVMSGCPDEGPVCCLRGTCSNPLVPPVELKKY